jgi:hypothetical protein
MRLNKCRKVYKKWNILYMPNLTWILFWDTLYNVKLAGMFPDYKDCSLPASACLQPVKKDVCWGWYDAGLFCWSEPCHQARMNAIWGRTSDAIWKWKSVWAVLLILVKYLLCADVFRNIIQMALYKVLNRGQHLMGINHRRRPSAFWMTWCLKADVAPSWQCIFILMSCHVKCHEIWWETSWFIPVGCCPQMEWYHFQNVGFRQSGKVFVNFKQWCHYFSHLVIRSRYL